jgi:hypothetical protein
MFQPDWPLSGVQNSFALLVVEGSCYCSGFFGFVLVSYALVRCLLFLAVEYAVCPVEEFLEISL